MVDRLVEEVLCSLLDGNRVVGNLRVDDGINCHVDIVLRRNGLLRLDVDRNETEAQLIGAFEERNLESGMPADGAELAETGDDDYLVRRSLYVGYAEEDEEEQGERRYSNIQ
jgi:hypothetical protein